jgi:hypothetical protein
MKMNKVLASISVKIKVVEFLKNLIRKSVSNLCLLKSFL